MLDKTARVFQSFAIRPDEPGLGPPFSFESFSFASISQALGGTSTAGEQLKNPYWFKNIIFNTYLKHEANVFNGHNRPVFQSRQLRTNQRTISDSSRGRFFFTQETNPSPTRGF
ncbi:class I peptide chain release factor [Striga asiatica]|uniref:Class I peptide chain release factor n=1 Tax=Striga asiatica TaxID=4170 RepID=A0A5A7RHV3_STRAF|nr:class I peptide chain release factor [Striga asiatica]